ncbi:MAG TPA: immunoglobulin domain-containing protein, partial [Verrucomicrobiota bacterium]|nr:immunoglobulin domain-containing protein [Verrucomicrobiota bacterium]
VPGVQLTASHNPASYNGIVAMGSLPNAVVLRGTVLVYNNGWHLLAEGGTIQAGRWSHLAFVYAPGHCTLYLDGEPLLSAASGLDFDAAELGLGARLDLEGSLGGPFGTGYGGMMDDVSIWDGALQPSSIRKLASGVSPKLVVDSPATEPPSIFAHPAGATVLLGTPATLSVVASGARALTYQWEKDGQPVDGATGSTLTFPAVTLADAGEYRVVVNNQYGTAISHVARLIVDPGVPVLVTQPQSQTKRVGAEAMFTVEATGALPLTYQWHKDGQAITGAIEPTYHVAAVSAADAGAYTVVVRNVSGSVISEVATLVLVFTPPAVNVDLAVASGQNVYTGVAAAPDPGTVWNQVTENALRSALDRTLALVDSDGLPSSIGFTSASFGEPGSGLFANNGGGNALQATYWHSGVGNESPPFGFTNLDPAVRYDVYVYGIATDFGLGYTQRISRVGGESQALNQVVNTGFPILHEDYALFRDITGVTEVMFTAGESGNGAVFSTVTGLQIIPATDTPKILQSPTDRFVRQGASVTFTVVATGTAPFTYQWRKNGVAIQGATGDTYVIASARADDEGLYSVVVSNAAGSVTSESGRLTLQTAPPAVNINLIAAADSSEYAGTAAAPDVGTVWNQVTEEALRADADREMALVDSDGLPVDARFFSGSFGEPSSTWFAENGGGNFLQRSYWHVGGGKASPEFGFRNLEAGKTYDVYVYGIATDFNLGWGQAYTLVGGPTQTLKQVPDTGFPVVNEDYVVFKTISGVAEIKLTSGQAGAFFSTVAGLQLIESAKGVPATLTITRSVTGEIVIGWTGSGVLEQADAVTGAWKRVANPANPYTAAPAGAARYYRVVQD